MATKPPKSSPSKSPVKGAEKKKETDAANLAKRKKETNEFEVDPKKTLKYTDWEQSNSDVTITLFAGKRLAANDISVEYNPNDVRISLTDGRRWYCRFCRDIIPDKSRVLIQKLKVILKAKKMEPGVRWNSYDFNAGDPPVITSPPDTKPSSTGKPSTQSATSKLPDKAEAPPTNSTAPKSAVSMQENGGKTDVLKAKNIATSHEKQTPPDSGAVSPVINSEGKPVNGTSAEHPKTNGEGAHWASQKTQPGEGAHLASMETQAGEGAHNIPLNTQAAGTEYELNLIKHDFYERDASAIVVVVYVKNTDKSSIQVLFGSKDLCLKFKTSDTKFLKLHSGTNEHTYFKWGIKVVDDIIKENCKYKVTNASVEITLAKADQRKWGALEASQARSARVPPTSASWQPVTKETTVKDKDKDDLDGVRLGGDTSSVKVMKETWNEKENQPSTSGATSRTSTILSDSNKENQSQKPTCMVSPLKTEFESGQPYPIGMMGLDNLGNTCFMNSVLQVLANTRELRDFFLCGVFQREINHENPLGMGGKLAVAFATLMKILWSGKHRSYAPTKLKSLVAMKNSQFMGFAQHDAQEFLAFLLDGLHEDVNRIRHKPYTQDVDSDGRHDEVVANEAWHRHKMRNDSFIVDLFQGQYKSKLVCPVCGKVSITFDPFMHLSVPLPKKRKRQLPVIFISKDPYKKPVRYILRLAKDAFVEDLKEEIYQKTGVSPSCQRVFESYKNKIQCFFYKGSSLANVTLTDKIYVCEILSEKLAGESVTELACIQRTLYPVSVPIKCSNCKRESNPGEKLKRCTKCFKTAYCDHTCQKQDWTRHRASCSIMNELVGQPFIISLPKSQATFSRLVQTMEAYSRYSLDVFQPPVNPKTTGASCVSPTPSQSENPTPSTSATDAPIITQSETSTASGMTNMPSTSDSQVSAQFSSQCSSDSLHTESSQGTSTTELASSSSDGSFVTVESASLDENCFPSDGDIGSRATNLEYKQNVHNEKLANKMADAKNCDSVMTNEKTTEATPATTPPTGYVLGRQQDIPDRTEPPFSIRPCSKDGKSVQGPSGHKLQDQGERPLELNDIYFIAMDWKNNEKCVPYVLVQSKNIDCEEDESSIISQSEASQNITLDQCLSLFTEPEVLSPDHAWYCPKCKEHREATKQLSIWRLPAYLIIQLKRFSFSSFIWRDKIDKLVEYPVRGLDLSQHFVGNLPTSEVPPIYDLYGVVNHMGGILGGHYTSYARCPEYNDWKRGGDFGWHHFDDSIVSKAAEKQVVTRAGYVLFYKRRNMKVDIPCPLLEDDQPSTDDERDRKPAELEQDKHNETVSNKSAHAGTPLTTVEGHGLENDDDAPGGQSGFSQDYPGPGTSPSTYSFTDMDTVD